MLPWVPLNFWAQGILSLQPSKYLEPCPTVTFIVLNVQCWDLNLEPYVCETRATHTPASTYFNESL